MSLQSLKYSRGSLEVLDQLLLPHESKYVPVLGVQDAWQVIRSMQVRGAPLIAITAALGLAVEAYKHKEGSRFSTLEAAAAFLVQSMEYLRTSRPTAVNLFLAMDELTALVQSIQKQEGKTANDLLQEVIEASEKIWEEDIATNRAIGRHGAEKILQLVKRSHIRVLTICNTGSLATAGFGTALGVVRALHEMGRLEHVYACETRPYNQGARLTAYEIVQDNLPGTLITDSMASALMAVKGVDVVVVGADRVAANGDTANKIGTYQLALAAKHHHVPFFPAVPTTTLDLSLSCGAEIHVEERPAHELTSLLGQKIAPDGISVWNPSFDVTPCNLITGVITELGVIDLASPDPNGMSRNSELLIPVAEYIIGQLEKQEETLKPSLKSLLQRARSAATPICAPIAYRRLDVSTLKAYINNNHELHEHLDFSPGRDSVDDLLIDEVGDGNLNFVYIIRKGERSIVVKQALPFVRCVGENWPLTLQRAEFEYQALTEELRMTEGRFVPEVFFFDRTNAVIAMRYVEPPHIILRKALIGAQRLSTLATDLGTFVALTLFRSSALNLPGGVFRAKVSEWSQNAALCALTEKVIFSDPYTTSALNRWNTPYLDNYAASIRGDRQLKLAASYFKRIFLTKPQSLLHADLHTGSVMVKEGSTFVIDPEFAFYGPKGFDLGAILSNLYLAYFSHSVRDTGDYAEWILSQISELYKTFQEVFGKLWLEGARSGQGLGELYLAQVYSVEEIEAGLKPYLDDVWRDVLGFTGMKMIRRIVGVAHVADLDTIEDPVQRSLAEKRALTFARRLAVSAYLNDFSEKGLGTVDEVNAKHARPIFATTPSEEWSVVF
eukprot:gene5751-6335_t